MSEHLYPKAERTKRDLSHRRWHVRYEGMIGEGCHLAPWTGYHHTWIGARIAAWWNQNIATYGGTVTLIDASVVRNG